MGATINAETLASKLGVTRVAVMKALTSGRLKNSARKAKIPGGYRWEFDEAKAIEEWRNNTRPRKDTGKATVPVTGYDPEPEPESLKQARKTPSLAEATAILQAYKAKREKLSFEREEGSLVEAAKVKIAAFNAARRARDRLLNIPDRVAGLLAAETLERKCHAILMQEIRAVCEELSRPEAEEA